MSHKTIYIFVASAVVLSLHFCASNHKPALKNAKYDWFLQPCFAREKDKDDEIDCAIFKSEIRDKYKLAAKKPESNDIEDCRVILKELEQKLEAKKADGQSLQSNKSSEAAMNSRMEIANLEYEIDKIGDFIPEIKTRKDKERKAESEKKASEDVPNHENLKKRIRVPVDINHGAKHK